MMFGRVVIIALLSGLVIGYIVSAVIHSRSREPVAAPKPAPASTASTAASRAPASPPPPAPVEDATARALRECEAGAGQQCTSLGNASLQGAGVPNDPDRAAELFRMGCNGGDPDGCLDLGNLIRLRRVSGTPEEVANLYRRACDRKGPGACAALGVLYLTGDGVKRDGAHGLKLVLTDCKAGTAKACAQASSAYARGDGTGRNVALAQMYLQKACTLGDADACQSGGR